MIGAKYAAQPGAGWLNVVLGLGASTYGLAQAEWWFVGLGGASVGWGVYLIALRGHLSSEEKSAAAVPVEPLASEDSAGDQNGLFSTTKDKLVGTALLTVVAGVYIWALVDFESFTTVVLGIVVICVIAFLTWAATRDKRSGNRRTPANRGVPSSSYVPRRPVVPAGIKQEVWCRDGGACRYCGSALNLEYDHIIPYSKGGADSVENLQILCRSCNRSKAARIE